MKERQTKKNEKHPSSGNNGGDKKKPDKIEMEEVKKLTENRDLRAEA